MIFTKADRDNLQAVKTLLVGMAATLNSIERELKISDELGKAISRRMDNFAETIESLPYRKMSRPKRSKRQRSRA